MVKISRGREIPCMKSHTKMKYHTRTFGGAPPPAEPASAARTRALHYRRAARSLRVAPRA
eukprot:scaffold95726_cov51-Phaeocystis_antarctica.AAC.2